MATSVDPYGILAIHWSADGSTAAKAVHGTGAGRLSSGSTAALSDPQ